jgi:hypothetical protein
MHRLEETELLISSILVGSVVLAGIVGWIVWIILKTVRW